MKKRTFAGLAIAIGLLGADTALAQADTRGQREEIERIIDNAPEQTGLSNPTDRYDFTDRGKAFQPANLGVAREFLWDVGAWLRMTHSGFDTQLNTDRQLQDYDLRIWGEASYEWISAYGRVRSLYNRYESGDAPDGNDDKWQALRLDQGYLKANLADALDLSGSTRLDLYAGRQFMALGSGLAFANVVDGLRMEWQEGDWSATALIANTLHHSPDIDASVPESGIESDRMFFGGQVSTRAYQKEMNTNMYAYFLGQIDNNNYSTPTQNWDYDSYYLGFGKQMSHDWLGLRPNEISTRTEVMLEFGRSTATGSLESESIFAWGYLADIYWLPGDRLPYKSKFVLSYYHGSGDPDRSDQHSTLGGNTPGTGDSALNYFGFASTGYVLAPKLTNLHMLRLNVEAVAIEDGQQAWMRSLKAGMSLFGFWKHHKNATITDFTSNEPSSFVGWEWDLYVDAQVASDLDVGIRYGVFFPGSAYLFDDSRNFFSAYLNFSF